MMKFQGHSSRMNQVQVLFDCCHNIYTCKHLNDNAMNITCEPCIIVCVSMEQDHQTRERELERETDRQIETNRKRERETKISAR